MSFLLYAKKNQLNVRSREPITSGSQNVYLVQFEFSEDWDGMTKTACFRSGVQVVCVLLDDSAACPIPWEVMDPDDAGKKLFAGVFGTREDGAVLPTVWACLGEILPGTSCGGMARPPTPGMYEQLLAALAGKGDRLEYDGIILRLLSGDRELSMVPIVGDGGGGGVTLTEATDEEVQEMLDEVFGNRNNMEV